MGWLQLWGSLCEAFQVLGSKQRRGWETGSAGQGCIDKVLQRVGEPWVMLGGGVWRRAKPPQAGWETGSAGR